MASSLNVNPTRMELQKLKSKLKTAQRGHKLLKDKTDEMMRVFKDAERENKNLREKVNTVMSEAVKSFLLSYTKMTLQEIEKETLTRVIDINLQTDTANVMGLAVPKISFSKTQLRDYSNQIDAQRIAAENIDDIIRLAELEKTCALLSAEIQKARRRTNALEFILIPQIKQTIQQITQKLAENERQTITRIMKSNISQH